MLIFSLIGIRKLNHSIVTFSFYIELEVEKGRFITLNLYCKWYKRKLLRISHSKATCLKLRFALPLFHSLFLITNLKARLNGTGRPSDCNFYIF